MIGTISNIYLLIFLPLISSLCCQILSGKKLTFYFTTFTSLLLFALALKTFPAVLNSEKIASDFQLSLVSIAVEFKLDLLGATFLILLLFLKIVTLFFFREPIAEALDEKSSRAFYSVFLLNLFALVGIFTSNNIFNLFFFFEIYAFSFFALSSISNDLKLLKISFRYFCLNAASSLIIIFSFFCIYLVFGEVNFDRMAENFRLLPKENIWFAEVIFALLALAIFMKFFPLWLYFKKLRSSSVLASFFIQDSLFIKTLIGVFLLLKFTYFFFGNNLLFHSFNFDLLLILGAIILIFYSAINLYRAKHLKLICIYFCLNNLGFMLAAIALQTIESMQALFFYVLSFALINFFIFIFASFLKKYFHTSNINKLWLLRQSHTLLTLPLKLAIFFIVAFPLSFLFFANWYLAFSSFKIGFEAFILVALLISNFVHVAVAIRMIDAFFSAHNGSEMAAISAKNYYSYLLSFWFLICGIYASILLANQLNSLSLRFASYLFSNTI